MISQLRKVPICQIERQMEEQLNKITICLCKDCTQACPCKTERGYCSRYCAHCKGDCGKPLPIRVDEKLISSKVKEIPKIGKKYYALSVGGMYIKIYYTKNAEDFVEPQVNLAVAWVEEKDDNTHYFLFKLCMFLLFSLINFIVTHTYVLSAKHAALNGLTCTLIQVNRNDVTNDNYRNVPRWKNGVERIGGNV